MFYFYLAPCAWLHSSCELNLFAIFYFVAIHFESIFTCDLCVFFNVSTVWPLSHLMETEDIACLSNRYLFTFALKIPRLSGNSDADAMCSILFLFHSCSTSQSQIISSWSFKPRGFNTGWSVIFFLYIKFSSWKNWWHIFFSKADHKTN